MENSLYDTITEFRPVMDQPIGKGALYAVGFGLSNGLGKFLARMTGLGPQYGAILLALLAKIRYVEDMVGEPLSEVLATTAWISAINRVVGLEQTVTSGVDKLTGSQTEAERVAGISWGEYLFPSNTPAEGLGQISVPAVRGGGSSPYAMKLAAIR